MSEDKTKTKDVIDDPKKIIDDPGTKPEENVPKARLEKVITERNELRKTLNDLTSKEEAETKQKLIDDGKLQELNDSLEKDVLKYKPYKEQFDTLDGAIREKALDELPDDKKEKFKNLPTPDLLNVVDALSSRPNPKDRVGTIDPKVDKKAFLKMDAKDKRKNWKQVIGSYQR